MKTSEQTDKLSPALIAAQLACGKILKDAKNDFLKAGYATLGSVLDATRDALLDNGIAIIQAGGEGSDGAISVNTRLLHSSGQWIEESSTIYLAKLDAQATGSAITYGRRYALQSMMGLAPEDDDDGEAATEQDPARRRDKEALRPPTDKQVRALKDAFDSLKASPENIAATCLKFSNGRTNELEALMQIEVLPLTRKLLDRFKQENSSV